MEWTTRKSFIKAGTAACFAPAILRAGSGKKKKFIWADILQLGCNMWNDHVTTPDDPYNNKVADFLRCDEKAWLEHTSNMRDIGMNMIVIDLAEGLVYPSHPELSVKGSWSPEKLRKELVRLRKMGLEPIPKLNFSAGHDIWLKEYSRMVSTPIYHKVISELVKDVCEIFDRPHFLHIGMDEEGELLQAKMRYAVTRREDVWFDDLNKIVAEVEKHGVRAWMWSDPCWNYPDFHRNVPKSVMQSNWYYWNDVREIEAKLADPKFSTGTKRPGSSGDNHAAELKGFFDLEKTGYEQIPCATTWNNDVNMDLVVDFCVRRLNPSLLKGFMLTSWQEAWDTEKARKQRDKFFPLAEKVIKKYDS